MKNIKIKKKCRLCDSLDLSKAFNLCKSPLANNLALTQKSSIRSEIYPLNLMFCNKCKHVQLQHVVNPKCLFDKYLYTSGISNQFNNHFKKYAKVALSKFNSSRNIKVLEIGSNDCTLLNYFKKKKCLTVGIEPAKNLFKLTKNNHHIINSYYNFQTNRILLKEYGKFDLILGNNVFAHIDNIKNVFSNLIKLMNDQSIIIFEVSYLFDVINKNLFDTIYHEHLDYHSIFPFILFFKKIGLKIINLERVTVHGGSIRFYLSLLLSSRKINQKKIDYYLKNEKNSGITTKKRLFSFYSQLENEKFKLKIFFKNIKEKKVYGYGASAKAVTLIHYLNLDHKHIKLVIDDSKLKQNKYIPGRRIRITNSKILNTKPPNYLIIFAWNVYKDIMFKLKQYKKIEYIVIPLPKFKLIKL